MRRVRDEGTTIDQELMVSRDGRHWSRPIRRPFIELGPKESWRYGVAKLFASFPIQRDGQLWIYYGGKTGLTDAHTGTGPNQAMSLALLRQDGFVSVDGGPNGGVLVTHPVKLVGRHLHLNADAEGGQIRVEIRDVQGAAIPGYEADECVPTTGDSLDATVGWEEHGSLDSLSSRPVRLALFIRNAALYSLWTDDG